MPAPAPERIVRLSLLFYVPMMLTGAFVRPPGTFRVADPLTLALGLAVAVAGGLLTVALSRVATERARWGRAMHDEFRGALGGLDSRQILALSLLSALGEEILFRGVLHPRLGLVWTALLFAALHFPYRRTMIPWSLFALVLGLVLGALTDAFGSLWPAVLLHFFINYFNLHDIVEGRIVPGGGSPGSPGGPDDGDGPGGGRCGPDDGDGPEGGDDRG